MASIFFYPVFFAGSPKGPHQKNGGPCGTTRPG
jgi:hypothetical protein